MPVGYKVRRSGRLLAPGMTIGLYCPRFYQERRPMSLDADAIVDRRRMRRKLTFWRVGALLIALLALVGAGRCAGARRRAGGARQLHRPHQGAGSDPRQPGPRRGARTPGQVARPRRDRAYRQSRRHHRRLRTALRFAARLAGEEADGRGGRRLGRLRRLYRGALAPTTSSPQDTSLVGSIGVLFQYPELHASAQNHRHPDGGDQVLAAEGGAERLRADQPGGARRDRRRSWSIPMPGSRAW